MNRAQASAGPALMKREKWDCLRVGGMLQQFCDLVNMSRKGSKEGGMERGREGKKKKKTSLGRKTTYYAAQRVYTSVRRL